MNELSLNILDLCQNSIKANASIIEIEIIENIHENYIMFSIKDNGCGMEEEFLKRICDPFTTTRTTRSVGLGIPFVKMLCDMCNGEFSIESKVNVGTSLKAKMRYDHIDRLPLGNICDTITTLIRLNTNIDFVYTHIININGTDKSFTLDTREIKKIMGDVSIDSMEVMAWLCDYINENLTILKEV